MVARFIALGGRVLIMLLHFSSAIAIGLGLLLAAGVATGAEIKVMSSAGFPEAYRNLIRKFERTTGAKSILLGVRRWATGRRHLPVGSLAESQLPCYRSACGFGIIHAR